jgi:uncharacterized membrane protein
MDKVTLARAIHVLAVIHWLGGMAFVTLVVLPIARLAEPARRLALFDTVERRFSAQVRVSVPVAGLSGLYMTWKLDAWSRFLDPASWWLAAMALLWALFMVILFVAEPLVGRRRFHRFASVHPDEALGIVQRLHWLLLAIATIVAAGAVLGAHGYW